MAHYYSEENSRRDNEFFNFLNNDEEEIQEEYWRTVQGFPNPYDKEFYDYVEQHKNIRFSSNFKIARQEMKEVRHKMYADPMHESIPTLPCKKFTSRLLLELGLSFLDSM